MVESCITDYEAWLRTLAAKGGKGVVDNIDARSLGRVAEQLHHLNQELAKFRVRDGEETGWVIERADSEPSRPMYYAGFDWSYDNLKAVRFAREQDARTMAKYMFPGEPHRIADHMWV